MATNGQTYILLNYLQQNREYDSLTIEKESITFDGKTINLEGFDVEKFLSENKNFVRDVSSLPMDDVFNIIKIHVDYSNVLRKQEEKNKQEEEEKARQEMEALIYSNPSFAKFQIFNNIDSLDYKKSFLKYSDDRGENFVFQDVTPKTFMEEN